MDKALALMQAGPGDSLGLDMVATQAVPDGERAWIGLHDRGASEAGCDRAGFLWSDGTINDFDGWANGEPNDWHTGTGGARCDGTGHEDCTEIMASRNMQWNDAVSAAPRSAHLCGPAHRNAAIQAFGATCVLYSSKPFNSMTIFT